MKRTLLFFFLLLFILPPAARRANAEEMSASSDTLELLSAYIGGCDEARDLSAMAAVGAVLLHRCADERYPDTISANGASLGILPTASPTPMAKYAAHLALSGVDPTSGALTFFAAEIACDRSDDYITYSASGLCFSK